MKDKSMKYEYIFPVEENPKLNITERIKTCVFTDNDKPMCRLGKPLIDTRCFLDHSIQRIQ